MVFDPNASRVDQIKDKLTSVPVVGHLVDAAHDHSYKHDDNAALEHVAGALMDAGVACGGVASGLALERKAAQEMIAARAAAASKVAATVPVEAADVQSALNEARAVGGTLREPAVDPVSAANKLDMGGNPAREVNEAWSRTRANTGVVDYTEIPDPQNVGAGKDFTRATKRTILEKNRAANGGTIRSDMSGVECVPPKQSKAGVTPPKNEAHIDHVKAKSKGGNNSPSNAQVLTGEENIKKSDG